MPEKRRTTRRKMLAEMAGATLTLPAFISTLTRGTEWAATGAVTIPLPAEMR